MNHCTNNRYADAKFIQEGACNPIAIAGTIHHHMLDMKRRGADHDKIKHDPAIRLMLHQLAWLCKVFSMEEPPHCDNANEPGHNVNDCLCCEYREKWCYSKASTDNQWRLDAIRLMDTLGDIQRKLESESPTP